MKTWLKAHRTIAILVGFAALWILYRLARGLSPISAGHASPDDAISYGWSVHQAGITGWLEVSPDGDKRIYHDTGWTTDPYRRA